VNLSGKSHVENGNYDPTLKNGDFIERSLYLYQIGKIGSELTTK